MPEKPSIHEYLKKLAPDFSVLDNVEQYVSQYADKNAIFYIGEKKKEYTIRYKRFLCKYEGTISFSDSDNLIIEKYEINDKKYAIIISDLEDGYTISGPTYICGVGF